MDPRDYPGYPDSQGWLHPTAADAIRENQGIESDFGRGSTGACSQDPNNVPEEPDR